MKFITNVMVAIPILFATGPIVALTLDPITPIVSCPSLQECGKMTTTLKPCCCETGFSEYVCPTGWTVSGSTCSRASTTGSDLSGYYTQEYGTCAATLTKCYKTSTTSDRNPDGSTCRCTSIVS